MNALQHAGINAAKNLKSSQDFYARIPTTEFVQEVAITHDYQGMSIGYPCRLAIADVYLSPHSHTLAEPMQVADIASQHRYRDTTTICTVQATGQINRPQAGLGLFGHQIHLLKETYRQDVKGLQTSVLFAHHGSNRPSLIEEILSLTPGWDGEGSIAPSSEAKRVAGSVAAYLSSYLDDAEVEVDPSDGGVSLRWFTNDEKAMVSIDIRPSGRIVVAGTAVEGRNTRKTLGADEVQRVLRAATDAGLTHIYDRLR